MRDECRITRSSRQNHASGTVARRADDLSPSQLKFNDLRKNSFMSNSQFIGIRNTQQMPNGAPAIFEQQVDFLEQTHQTVPVGGFQRLRAVQQVARLSQNFANGGLHMFSTNLVERRNAGLDKQRILRS